MDDAASQGDRVIDLLDERRANFVREFLVDCNAAKAAARAKYSRQQGYNLLSEPLIQLAIAEEKADRAERLKITADRVVEELALLAFSDVTDYVDVQGQRVRFRDFTNISPDKRRAIAEISQLETDRSNKLSFKLHDKMKAITKLCDHLGIAIQRHILQGDAEGGPVRLEQSQIPLPPPPQTIEEWEEQVRRAEELRVRRSPLEGVVDVVSGSEQDEEEQE